MISRSFTKICRLRGVPIFTFMNKLDRPARPPIELLDELESALGIAACPLNWPLGDGPRFRGLIDRRDGSLHLFERTPGGAFRAPEQVVGIRDPKVTELVDAELVAQAAEELDLLDEAWPGDIVGLVGNQPFRIGDTLSSTPGLEFDEIPLFPPECFATVRVQNTAQMKRFRSGLGQFASEGVVQIYELANAPGTVPLLGAVGPLQFEVLQYRLEAEYGAIAVVEPRPWTLVRWIAIRGEPVTTAKPPAGPIPSDSALARDPLGRWTLLFESEWSLRSVKVYQPEWILHERPEGEFTTTAMPVPS